MPKASAKKRPAGGARGSLTIVLTTFANAADAERVAGVLVEERLAACVTCLPGARSIYAWRGKIERAAEVVALVKTRASVAARLTRRLRELHPYETPEIVAWTAKSGNGAYLAWLEDWVRAGRVKS